MTRRARVWLVDDDTSLLWVLERALSGAGFTVSTWTSGDEAMAALARARPDVLVTDIRMPGADGLRVARQVREDHPGLPVIIMTAHSDLDTTVAAFTGGAFDYLAKPFDLDDAVATIRRACEGVDEDAGDNTAAVDGGMLIGDAPAMQALFRAIGRLSRAPATVLITGESGTGKERVAQALHRHSPRAGRPFVALNMAAIPGELLESELFGHEKGAFTGAGQQRIGRFEQADGGTLFLDEIGDMPAAAQTRLLRVLAEGSFHRVGGQMPVRVDVRIIAATHQDLQARVERGEFREDLYHRLNVVRLAVPALRERREDIALLARHFLQQSARELGVEAKTLDPAAEAALRAREWPGNVRELENLCRWLTAMAPGAVVRADDLPGHDGDEPGGDDLAWVRPLAAWIAQRLHAGDSGIAVDARNRLERVLIERALAHTGGHRQQAARLLGWGRNTLTRRMRELDLDR